MGAKYTTNSILSLYYFQLTVDYSKWPNKAINTKAAESRSTPNLKSKIKHSINIKM